MCISFEADLPRILNAWRQKRHLFLRPYIGSSLFMESPPTPGDTLATELLVASFGLDGNAHHRDTTWRDVFGTGDTWERLEADDVVLVTEALQEAAQGNLVTHQVVSTWIAGRAEPTPTLLHFLPTFGPRGEVVSVAVTGELLTQPGNWNVSQTRRNRMETLGRMSMAIAHDLNNLLSGILGHTELLKLTAAAQNGAAEHVHTIERAALDGAAIVRKIQQYVRQESRTATSTCSWVTFWTSAPCSPSPTGTTSHAAAASASS